MSTKYDYTSLTFGADPEVFASYTKDEKEFVEPPAYFRFELSVPSEPDKESEYNKHPVYIRKDNIIVMEDGCAFEYTLPPSTNAAGLFNEVQTANSMLAEWLQKYKYDLYIKPVINYDTQRFIGKTDDYLMGLIFGCDRDNDAIEEGYVCRIIDATLHPYRYGGGHFHIGSFDPNVGEMLNHYCKSFIKLLACLVGTASIKNTPYPELETVRATTYGRPGRFRNQKWGVEYRTPSNSWVNKLSTLEEMVEGAKKAFELLQNPERGKKLIADKLDDAVQSIKTADIELASRTYIESLGY